METYGKEIVSLLVPLVTWVLNTFYKAKVKLLLANPHTFTFLVEAPLLDAEGKEIAPKGRGQICSWVIRLGSRDSEMSQEQI